MKAVSLATLIFIQLPPKICGKSGCVPNRITGNDSKNYMEFAKKQNSYISPKRIIMGLYDWDFAENKWQKIFSTSMRNVSEIFHENIIPVNDQDALYCITLKKELAQMKTVLKLIPPKNNVFVPGKNSNIYQIYSYWKQYNLHQSTSGYIPFGYVGSNTDVKIEVSSTKLKSSNEVPCNNDVGYSYDDCLFNAQLEGLTCLPAMFGKYIFNYLIIKLLQKPALNIILDQFNTSLNVCTEKEESQEALSNFSYNVQYLNHHCKIPCTQYTIKSTETQYNFLGSNYILEKKIENKYGYIVEIRDRVLNEEFQETYTIISLIAEFGGWCGVCVGISLISIIESLLASLSPNIKEAKNSVKKLVLIVIKFFCSIFLIYIAIVMIQKFLSKELLTSLQIGGSVKNFNVTVCSSIFLAEDVFEQGSSGLILNLVGIAFKLLLYIYFYRIQFLLEQSTEYYFNYNRYRNPDFIRRFKIIYWKRIN